MVSSWCLRLVLVVVYFLPLPFVLFFPESVDCDLLSTILRGDTSGFHFLIAAASIKGCWRHSCARSLPTGTAGSELILVPYSSSCLLMFSYKQLYVFFCLPRLQWEFVRIFPWTISFFPLFCSAAVHSRWHLCSILWAQNLIDMKLDWHKVSLDYILDSSCGWWTVFYPHRIKLLHMMLDST